MKFADITREQLDAAIATLKEKGEVRFPFGDDDWTEDEQRAFAEMLLRGAHDIKPEA